MIPALASSIATARWHARQALAIRAEINDRARDELPREEIEWLRKWEKSHVDMLAHSLLHIAESDRPQALKDLCAQVWL